MISFKGIWADKTFDDLKGLLKNHCHKKEPESRCRRFCLHPFSATSIRHGPNDGSPRAKTQLEGDAGRQPNT